MNNMKKIVYITLVIPFLLAPTQTNTLSWEGVKDATANCLTTLSNNRKPLIAVAAFYGLYKAYTHYTKKYHAHMRSIALDESIKKHFTNAKIAEIAGATNGLSNGDLQGIINKIKTYASITQDGRATPEIINLAVKEYVDKHNTFKDAHNKKKA